MKSKKKAFTLTELLVVVIVIGVLSAVVLPKFGKVLETRKTTEAEELMSAVRTEQEKRCALDKDYLANLADMTDVLPVSDTKNFSYSLTSAGMEASSKGKYGYKLRMPSYKDGRICCDNAAECAKLNKDYPLCEDLLARADYQNGAECAAEPVVKECTGSSSRSCGCNNGGTQTRTCDTSTGAWSNWGACSISDACSCEGENTQACGCQGKGTQSRTCNTSNGTWGEWGSCSVSDECECEGESTQACGCQNKGTQTRTCNGSTGTWGDWSECSMAENCCEIGGYFMGHISACCQVARSTTDSYFLGYPGADSAYHTDQCSTSDGAYGEYTCTTNDYVNGKTCNEYVLDTKSGSGEYRYPSCSAGSSSISSMTFNGGYWSSSVKYGQRTASSSCTTIPISSINGTGGSNTYPILPEVTETLCRQNTASGATAPEGYLYGCTVIWPQNTYNGGTGWTYKYVESILYCSYGREDSGGSGNSCTSSYHVTVNRVNCCVRRTIAE